MANGARTRPSEPQSDALTNWAITTIFVETLAKIIKNGCCGKINCRPTYNKSSPDPEQFHYSQWLFIARPFHSKTRAKQLLKARKGKKFMVFALFLGHVKRTKIPIEYEKTSDCDFDVCCGIFLAFQTMGTGTRRIHPQNMKRSSNWWERC